MVVYPNFKYLNCMCNKRHTYFFDPSIHESIIDQRIKKLSWLWLKVWRKKIYTKTIEPEEPKEYERLNLYFLVYIRKKVNDSHGDLRENLGTGTDLGGLQGTEGTPWAPQGVPGTPCGFGQEELKMLLLSNEVAATYFDNFLHISEIVSSVRKIINLGIQFLQINRNLKYVITRWLHNN